MDVRFDETVEGCKAAAKKASEGSFVMKDHVLMEYKMPDGNVGKIRSPVEGVVSYQRSVQRGAVLENGQIIANVKDCTHAIVIKDMCATCGKDLREKGGRVGQRKEQTTANVSMIHHVPELIVSDSLAKEIGSADETNLLATRKLVLLVDLDQTVIHTSNLPFTIDPEKHTDVTKYNIGNGAYTTKLRPHTMDFLNKMTTMYEMHIVTYGQRQYAHRIAQILDPDARLFGQRILSRDELFSAQHKTRNLKALFPCGDKLVVIIDDRADVWQYSEALIQVKPYRFFKEIGDINAPKGSKEQSIPSTAVEDAANSEDRVLEEIERVLTNIHDKYYELHDLRAADAPLIDVKEILNDQRRRVLDGSVIVLSGIVPMNEKIEKTDVYRLCVQFGAKIVDSVTDETTHVVAARWGTNKVHQALRAGKHVVTVQWIYACVEKWLKADEKLFELTKETTPPSGKPLGSKYVNDLANMSTIGKTTLADMNNEVDELLGDDDDDDDDDEDENKDEDEPMENGDNSQDGEDQRAMAGNEQTESPSRKRKHAPEEEWESDDEDKEGDNDEAPMSYAKLLSKSKKAGRIAGDNGDDEIYDVDDEHGHDAAVHNEPEEQEKEEEDFDDDDDDDEDEENNGDTDDDDDFEDMAAMIERQVSHEGE